MNSKNSRKINGWIKRLLWLIKQKHCKIDKKKLQTKKKYCSTNKHLKKQNMLKIKLQLTENYK